MRLIINADDYGYSKGITDGIVDGIKAGAVTSTTLMTNTVWSKYAIQQALSNNLDCIGLHVVFTYGRPLTNCPSLCDTDGKFLDQWKQAENHNAIEEEVYIEVKAQLEFATSRGIKITHIDTHHFSKAVPAIQNGIYRVCREYNLPARNEGDSMNGVKTTDVFDKSFFGDNATEQTIKEVIAKYKGTGKTVELMCHVGYMDEETLAKTIYKHEREHELQVLIKAKQNGVFDGIELISFKDL